MAAMDVSSLSQTPDQIAVAQIVAKSAFVYECVEETIATPERSATTANSLSALTWSEISGGLKEKHFEKRLSWEADLARALRSTGAARLDRDRLIGSEEPWTRFLKRLLFELDRVHDDANDLPLGEELAVIPFSRVLRPVAELMLQLLPLASLNQLFSEQARLDLSLNVYKGCSELSLDLLLMEFNLFKACSELDSPSTAFDAYLHFVQQMKHGGFKNLLQENPVFARILCTHACQVVQSFELFLRHLSQDQELLENHFNPSERSFPVASFSGNLSDPHHNGRRVQRLTMHDGTELIYKPRRIVTEELLAELLLAINRASSKDLFSVVNGVYLEDHGWVQAVLAKACDSMAEVERFYERSGALMCLLFLLEANDCHSENLIAHGEFPVLIDAETLLQCRVPSSFLGQPDNPVAASGASLFCDSVFRVGMLPRWSGRAGALKNSGGLAAPAEQVVKRRRLVKINSEFMAWSVVSENSAPDACHVLLGPSVQDPAKYVDSIAEGFSAMYRFAEVHRELFTEENGPAVRIAKEHTRFLFRNTSTYDGLLRRCRNISNLADGHSFSLPLEALLLPVIAASALPPGLEIIKAERQQLLRGDIPYLTACPITGAIWADGKALACEPLLPAWPFFAERLRNLGTADLQLQIAYIRASFTSLSAGEPDSRHTSEEAADAEARIEPNIDLVAAAIQIAEDLTRHGITVGSSSNWITRAYNPEAQSWQLQPMQPNLYDGVLGPAVFYAALTVVTGDKQYGIQARRALETVRASLAQSRSWLDLMPVGAGIGLGSVVYTCAVIAELLSDEGALEAALLAASLLRPERLAADTVSDTISGSSGALLGLVKLYKLHPNGDVLAKATDVARELLRRQTRTGQQAGSWATLEGKALCGVSHGASGIAMALSRFSEICSDPECKTSFEDALDYEDRHFDVTEANWPTLLEKSQSRLFLRRSWCHGAPGIVLARLTLPGYVPRQTDRSALERMRRSTATGLDHLCCGDLGVSETLLAIAEAAGDVSLAERAKQITQGVLHRVQRRATFRLGVPDGLFTPGFHQGVSGIGYHLLRLSGIACLPCVLNWS